jgi:hypothetical protein
MIVPEFSVLARLRGRSQDLCAGCRLPLTAELWVRDIDANGELGDYHQACAPSLAGHIDAQRLGRERARRLLP